MVFGFCVSDCGTFNSSGEQSVSVMQEVYSLYPCNGGAFFWVAHRDIGGVWSDPVYTEVSQYAGCSKGAGRNAIR